MMPGSSPLKRDLGNEWSFMKASKESPRKNLEVGFWPYVLLPTLVEGAFFFFCF